MNTYPHGSVWRKWDLQVHAPDGKIYDGYKLKGSGGILDAFCNELEKSDVGVIGITDYFSFDNFKTVTDHFRKKYPKSEKRFFFNLELRLNETVNKELEEVNIHLIFNPTSLGKITKFLNFLEVVKTGKDETPILCSELKLEDDFKSATVTRFAITEAFKKTYGEKAIRQDHFLVVTAANNDGLRPERGKKRKEGICDEIDKFSDVFFGGAQNAEYYLKTDRYEDDVEAPKKPVISSSDSHSFDDLEKYLGKRWTETIEKSGKPAEAIVKEITWIKADPTYEGLKQILYEPVPDERVCLGPIKPDEKDAYKVIHKIIFSSSIDFPSEIEFNDNLCSIIGSRSSGKSALLAYIAHAIDPKEVETIIPGPGEGEEYHWSNLDLVHSVEWANGKSNDTSPGSVVYIPQNYLFDKSKDAREIKEKIQPVLFKVLPDFSRLFTQSNTSIEGLNDQIAETINEWFVASDAIKTIDSQLKELGDKKAIEQQRDETDLRFKNLRDKNKLSDADMKRYQSISEQILVLDSRDKEIDSELAAIGDVSTTKDFFASLKITMTPSTATLPVGLLKLVKEIIEKGQEGIIKEANKVALDYKNTLKTEKSEKVASVAKIKSDNKDLLEKYQKNAELEGLVKTLAGYGTTLKRIAELEADKKAKHGELIKKEKIIGEAILGRQKLIDELLASIKSTKQDAVMGIRFEMESGFGKGSIEQMTRGLNMKERTQFVEKNQLKLDEVRNSSGTFLAEIYNGKQRITAGYEKEDVAKEVLCKTEEMFFTAEMEGDKIGGLSESTMTPGKRALFALRLILAESEDTWPLLIDQPEDDLDSRSIYDEVVPFLKLKKKERQIIMVSHNANLVIGSDSEQLIIANRHGNDRKNQDGKQFNYLTGSLEFTQPKDSNCIDTLKAQGICEHACSILDGGKAAFESRKNRYHVI